MKIEQMKIKTVTYFNLCVIAIVSMVVILYAMGRPWTHPVGAKLYYSRLDTDEASQHIFDQYSFTHVSHGILFYLVFNYLFPNNGFALNTLLSIVAEVLWEIGENSDFIVNKYRSQTISLGYFGDSIINAVADIACCILGIFIAIKFPLWASIGYFLVSEAVLALLIRDNIILNIIMLVFPSEKIKKWQAYSE